MHERFRQHVEFLHPSFESLLRSAHFTFGLLPKDLPRAGIYLFSEADRHLYVGRTNSIRKRLQQHCRPGSTHNSAPFAFRLAREARNALKATYKKEGSRAHLIQDPEFAKAFTAAKARLRAMHIRVVEESNPLRQALLEMYVAVSLEAPYNDFDNH
ncbi:GIY-YIG nuclease family protein [Stenotrophomonas acidaminiphila]|uniref:GIY-YIG nuclease family protein n=1 Tax=Stenotrophomonas acidaminiphila TaxID=128780 RepID=UPI001CF2D4B5|nr:GIY-YIG nuclease family protein [Stenotrophomonas acidaminiphila]MCE4076585.1 GIY-YIG nuclease family protein [Stenotrophomonas acidaminiphila]